MSVREWEEVQEMLRIVTPAPAWPAHPAWLAQFLKILGTRIDP